MAETVGYICPNCGGELKFDSDMQKLFCIYCDNVYDVSQFKEQSEELNNEYKMEQNEWTEEEQKDLFVYECSNCGGEIIGNDTLGATKCPYCDMPVVLKSQFSGKLKPKYIIPFKYKKDAAVEGLKKICRGKKLLPKSFTANNRVESIQGLYVPFWIFSANCTGSAQFSATKVSSWSDSKYNYTKTDIYKVIRNGDVKYNKVPIDGSKKMDDEYMEAVEPFSYNELVEFNPAYMAGYIAERYDVGLEESQPRAEQRMKSATRDYLRQQVKGYSSVRVTSDYVDCSFNEKAYAMLPVWILSTRYNGELYTYIMNGQTGKVVGKLPIDKGRAVRYFLGITAGIGILLSVITNIVIL